MLTGMADTTAQSWVRDEPAGYMCPEVLRLRLHESRGPFTNNHSRHLITQPPLTFQGLVELRRAETGSHVGVCLLV